MSMGYNKDIEAGRHMKYQIDKYMSYRYADAFLREIGDPLLHVSCNFDPHRLSYRFIVETRPRIAEGRIFKTQMEIDCSQLDQMMMAGTNRDEWILYSCQDILPQIDTGLFSCWFVSRLQDRLQLEYQTRVLPELQSVRLIPFNRSNDRIDRGSLAVVYLRNGGEWRETIINIEDDPQAFFASLLMLMP